MQDGSSSGFVTWYRSPVTQVYLLGAIFLLNFSAYITIQAFSAKLYGDSLASNMEVTLYMVFTLACFLSPSITNKLGSRRTMFLGVLGYAALVAASLVYFLGNDQWPFCEALVIIGGACTGFGAALLWTSQGRMLLQYVEIDGGRNGGKLFGIFWGMFNVSAILGGMLSFVYFSKEGDGAASSTLYYVFLCLILLGATTTFLLASPTELAASMGATSASLSKEHEDVSHDSWWVEIKKTLRFFRSRNLLALSCLFLTTGLNQPYQLVTFEDRFFNKRTVGLGVMVFYGSEIIGAIIIGRVLDNFQPEKRKSGATVVMYALFAVVLFSNVLAYSLEFPYAWTKPVKEIDYTSSSVLIPSLVFFLWGFSDVIMQCYSYWILGIFFTEGHNQARAIGFFKMVQSAGWCIGFALVPSARIAPIVQLSLTFICFLFGAFMALLALPPNQSTDPHVQYSPLLKEPDITEVEV